MQFERNHMTYGRDSRKLDRFRKSRSKTRGQAALRQKARTPRIKAMQAHASSRGRRRQARRDSS
jgi:hypothetical protein